MNSGNKTFTRAATDSVTHSAHVIRRVCVCVTCHHCQSVRAKNSLNLPAGSSCTSASSGPSSDPAPCRWGCSARRPPRSRTAPEKTPGRGCCWPRRLRRMTRMRTTLEGLLRRRLKTTVGTMRAMKTTSMRPKS